MSARPKSSCGALLFSASPRVGVGGGRLLAASLLRLRDFFAWRSCNSTVKTLYFDRRTRSGVAALPTAPEYYDASDSLYLRDAYYGGALAQRIVNSDFVLRTEFSSANGARVLRPSLKPHP